MTIKITSRHDELLKLRENIDLALLSGSSITRDHRKLLEEMRNKTTSEMAREQRKVGLIK